MNNLFYVLRTFKLIAKFKLFSYCAMIRTKVSKRGAKHEQENKRERLTGKPKQTNKKTQICVSQDNIYGGKSSMII